MTIRPKAYVICTSPRSGSTLLCKLLAATKRAGNPDSHFHQPDIGAWLKTYDLNEDSFASDWHTLDAIFTAARKRGSGDSGLFGLRMQRRSFAFFMRQLALLCPGTMTDPDRIEATFGPTRFIHLTRQDKLSQAISLVKATQTGLWHRAADGSELERLSPSRGPSYDPEAIAKSLAEVTALDAAWLDWFDGQDIHPLRVTYDELSAHPIATLATVLDLLSVDQKAARHIRPSVAKLADATSEEWAKRFRAEHKFS